MKKKRDRGRDRDRASEARQSACLARKGTERWEGKGRDDRVGGEERIEQSTYGVAA